ncbi:hypothetical protein BCR36DRAFT_340691 [Piromyces finnis]|uniref:PH domain-containing protein n=1 Tax=Piromyces finnis TaxID=1754191 RepID=A0A1Y1VN16_9FUNG|nr:hypothetical protein BCR36DRAFT_340691 [Piromyces finnis]|eukprot:ORX60817.1 hypothetical protein BCR36DRAFT_340691 [Piromyces finnis]
MPQSNSKKEFPYPEHIQYWPYAEEQYSRTLNTFGRFKSWKNVIVGIIEFFEKVENLDNCYSKQYSKLASVLEPSEFENCGSFKSLEPIYNSAKKIGINYLYSSNVIREVIIQKLNELKNGLIKKSKKYKQDFLEEFAKISKIRSETLVSINNHQNLTLAKMKSASLEITDPWLSERALINQLEKMLKDENDYQCRMNEIFEDMEEFDQHIVNQLQNVFDEYNSNKNKECNDVKLNLQNTSNVGNMVTPNKPFSYFTKKYSITSSDLWTTQRTLDNFVYKLVNVKILKEGVLYRQGNYISSNWKPSWLVLTDTGYLHCFNLKLSKCTIREFTINKKGTGENILQAGKDTYMNTDKVKTNFSIQLRSPRVVAVNSTRVKDSDPEYIFDIIVNNSAFNVVPPSSESNDGNEAGLPNNSSNNDNTTTTTTTSTINNNKVKKAKSNKNQEIHSLRCDTNEILEDWLNIINLKLKDMPVEVQPSIIASTEVVNLTNTINNKNIIIKNNHVMGGGTIPNDSNNYSLDENNQYSDNNNNISSNEEIDEGENDNTPLNGQIYPPFKSMATLIEEVNNVNESLKQQEPSVPSLRNQNPTIKSIKSSESIKYYLDSNKRPKNESGLNPEINEMLTQNILTSDINIGTDVDALTKTINYFCQDNGSSDMTLNQPIV